MAIKRLNLGDYYGQVELNNVAFRRDGRIEAQCKAGEGMKLIENGMLLAVDSVNGTVAPALNGELPVALVYSAEHLYEERALGLKNFALKAENNFLPRLGYLAKGDKWHSNCVAYDEGEFPMNVDEDDTFIEALNNVKEFPLYGGVCENGAILVSSNKPEFGPVLEVVKKGTMPDGQLGIQFRVLAD